MPRKNKQARIKARLAQRQEQAREAWSSSHNARFNDRSFRLPGSTSGRK